MSKSLSQRRKQARRARTPPYPQDATHVLVEMIPQVWHNGRATDSDNTETYLVPIEEATGPNGVLPADHCEESDKLREHENAPERAQNWYGPFEVELQEMVSVIEDGKVTLAGLPSLYRKY